MLRKQGKQPMISVVGSRWERIDLQAMIEVSTNVTPPMSPKFPPNNSQRNHTEPEHQRGSQLRNSRPAALYQGLVRHLQLLRASQLLLAGQRCRRLLLVQAVHLFGPEGSWGKSLVRRFRSAVLWLTFRIVGAESF